MASQKCLRNFKLAGAVGEDQCLAMNFELSCNERTLISNYPLNQMFTYNSHIAIHNIFYDIYILHTPMSKIFAGS